jgi:hypothetical protein
MSWNPELDPNYPIGDQVDNIETIIVTKVHDLGGFQIQRALPSVQRNMVGPFVFFDHIGPAEFIRGNGVDVRPHPHIGPSTVTYLYNGSMYHKDSIGTSASVDPGDVNLMTAGKGLHIQSARLWMSAKITTSCLVFRHGLPCLRNKKKWHRRLKTKNPKPCQ